VTHKNTCKERTVTFLQFGHSTLLHIFRLYFMSNVAISYCLLSLFQFYAFIVVYCIITFAFSEIRLRCTMYVSTGLLEKSSAEIRDGWTFRPKRTAKLKDKVRKQPDPFVQHINQESNRYDKRKGMSEILFAT